jgi:hypothetical protein
MVKIDHANSPNSTPENPMLQCLFPMSASAALLATAKPATSVVNFATPMERSRLAKYHSENTLDAKWSKLTCTNCDDKMLKKSLPHGMVVSFFV